MSDQLTRTQIETSRNKVTEILKRSSAPGTMSGLKDTDVNTVLQSYKGSIARALPKHLTPERMIQMASTLIAKNPAIAKCTASSLVGAVMQASILGLPPVEALGYCYFVPYGNSVQFSIGYKGYIALARRSGQLAKIYAEVVYENDTFTYERGLDPKLNHTPTMGERGEIRCVYAVYHLKDGFSDFVVLSVADIEGYRKRSPSQSHGLSGAWKTDYAAMAKKTAIRRLSTYLPLQVDEIESAVSSDEAIITHEDFAPDGSGTLVHAEVVVSDTDSETPVAQAEEVEKKEEPKRRGRPAGSTNKPKEEVESLPEAEVVNEETGETELTEEEQERLAFQGK